MRAPFRGSTSSKRCASQQNESNQTNINKNLKMPGAKNGRPMVRPGRGQGRDPGFAQDKVLVWPGTCQDLELAV